MSTLRQKMIQDLQLGDIDSERMLVHVHRGKGGKDRYVPLPPSTLALLRQYWSTQRNPTWLFPNKARRPEMAATATEPMNKAIVQRAIRSVVDEVGIKKHVTVHTLRHSYATHLLEAGVCSTSCLAVFRKCGTTGF